MAISQGRLVLTPPPERRGPHMPIDYFLHSLALEKKSRRD